MKESEATTESMTIETLHGFRLFYTEALDLQEQMLISPAGFRYLFDNEVLELNPSAIEAEA